MKITKRPPNKRGGDAAVASIYRRQECIGTTRNGGEVKVSVNSRPLDALVQQSSLRSRKVYDYKKGEYQDRKLDVLTNAQRNISKLKTRAVTTNNNGKSKSGEGDFDGMCCPVGDIPTIGGRR